MPPCASLTARWFFEQTPGQPYPHCWLPRNTTAFRHWPAVSRPARRPTHCGTTTPPGHSRAGSTKDRDLGVWLPYLSAYMGHATYTATAYYIHLLPQRIAATGLTAAAGIIPEPPL